MTFTSKDKDPEALFNQAKQAAKKYHGVSNLQNTKTNPASTLYSENEIPPEIEKILVGKGWKAPNKRAREEKEYSENGYNEKGEWRKCWLCLKDNKCKHGTAKCKCPCSLHLANKCNKKRKKQEDQPTVADPTEKPEVQL